MEELHTPLRVEHIRLVADSHNLDEPEHLMAEDILRGYRAVASRARSVEVGKRGEIGTYFLATDSLELELQVVVTWANTVDRSKNLRTERSLPHSL